MPPTSETFTPELQLEIPIVKSKVSLFHELSKPGISYLALTTTLTGFILATVSGLNFALLVHTLIGTFFVAAGGGSLNMVLEHDIDQLMNRTKNRPIPSGKISYMEGLLFGTISSITGIIYLALFVNILTSILGALTIGGYLFIYTPLKKHTSLSTIIGGFPGAIPPMMGWTAVRNEISIEAWVLFAILYLWQIPHFLAIAWMYRKDYERAGFPMLPVIEPDGISTSKQILYHCIALVPVSLLPSFFHLTAQVYFYGAIALGLMFLWYGIVLVHEKSNANAKKMLLASIFYIPLLLALIFIDKGITLFFF